MGYASRFQPSGISRIRGGDPVISMYGKNENFVFPAYAGVILKLFIHERVLPGISRIRGGDP